MTAAARWRVAPELVVVLAGVSAALHVGKLSPALPVLRDALQVSLLEAGFLLSMVQLAGMLLGLVLGVGADGFGLRRSMLAGLVVLALASAAGGWARDASVLLALRALEGLGFLLVSLPAPGLIMRLVDPARRNAAMGLWGAYMPTGTALALLFGPWIVAQLGWPVWWWSLAAISLLMAFWLWSSVPPDCHSSRGPGAAAPRVTVGGSPTGAWMSRLVRTVSAPGPWLVALVFAVYAGQWLAVIGFLPSVFVTDASAGVLAAAPLALVAAVNMVGNIASGRLLQRGIAPHWLLVTGFSAMVVGACLAFVALPGGEGAGLPIGWRYAGVLLFSLFGGMVPGTLFSLAGAVAPDASCVSTTVGWMQQWSSFGQFALPPVVGWVAGRAGNWHGTWLVTGSCALAGIGLAMALRTVLRRELHR
jgi:CP family cyanate transporter-like MFS transporter